MGIKAKAYLALMLSLVLLAGVAVAPACAHGASCAYTAGRGLAVASMPPMPMTAAESHVEHCGASGTTSGLPMKGASKSCCSDQNPSRMRLADDRANFTQAPTVDAVAVASLDVLPAMRVSAQRPLPGVSPPAHQALSSTIIRI